jgi:hypothetical protein
MKHIILTILVCLDVAAFAALYERTNQIVMRTILEGLSQISVSTASAVPLDLMRTFVGCRRASVDSEVIK